MSQRVPKEGGLIDNVTAAEDLYAHRFIGADGYYCGASEKAKGVSTLDTELGSECPVKMTEQALVEAGGSITPGRIASDEDGKAVMADFPEGTTAVTGADIEKVNGWTDDTASDGEFIVVDLSKP